MTTLTCAAVAGLWRASGPGAAVGRLCCQPAAPAAGRAQVLGWCRLARPQAALWRFRSRARPRPLIGSCGRGFLGRGRSAVVALHLSPTRSWRRIGHLRCWGEAHAASRLRGRRCRPAGSALARVDPVSGAEEPRSGCFAVPSLVLGHRKEGCSADIGSLSKLCRIFRGVLGAWVKLQVAPSFGIGPKIDAMRVGEVMKVFLIPKTPRKICILLQNEFYPWGPNLGTQTARHNPHQHAPRDLQSAVFCAVSGESSASAHRSGTRGPTGLRCCNACLHSPLGRRSQVLGGLLDQQQLQVQMSRLSSLAPTPYSQGSKNKLLRPE